MNRTLTYIAFSHSNTKLVPMILVSLTKMIPGISLLAAPGAQVIKKIQHFNLLNSNQVNSLFLKAPRTSVMTTDLFPAMTTHFFNSVL